MSMFECPVCGGENVKITFRVLPQEFTRSNSAEGGCSDCGATLRLDEDGTDRWTIEMRRQAPFASQ